MILDDARGQNVFAEDEYMSRKQARSLLCLPLLKQAELIGVLYLENSLASHVFTPARIAVLKLLASQAAIALENARLYRDVAEREAEARESARRYREVQMELAHANRVATMGQLSASIAHEVSQPIGSALNNARAASEFFRQKLLRDLDEVREALGCIVGDADRAGGIIERIRDQIKKAPPRKARFDLNKAINEVIVLARSEITKNGVSVQTRLTEGVAPVQGDRVQLQQVVLNLILNAVEAMSSVEAGPRELLISTEQTRRATFSWQCAIPGRALIRNTSSASSRLSTPRSPAEWGWGCRSAGLSSMPMGAGCGQM